MTEEEQIAVYRLLAVPGLGARTLARVLTSWRKDRDLIESFWGRQAEEYRADWGMPIQASGYLEAQKDVAESWEAAETAVRRSHEREIELLTALDASYAELADAHGLPPLLFTRGNQDLLWNVGVAIPHSRDASESALAWGADVAISLAQAGYTLVCGHNRDGYQRVGAAAKRAKAPLVIVLDRPLDGAPAAGIWAEPLAAARVWDERFRPERELLVSPFRPVESWTPRHARARDALVIEIARVIVAGDVRPGGTMAGECLRAIASRQLVFRSCFCRADLPTALLPEQVGAATAMVLESVREASMGSGKRPGSPIRHEALPQPGWRERRWLTLVS